MKKKLSLYSLVLVSLVCVTIQTAYAQNLLISDIVITGNTNVATETIRRKLPYNKNGTFDADDREKPAQAIAHLMSLGYFSQVTLEKEETTNGVTLFVTVTEKPLLTTVSFVGNQSFPEERLLEEINADQLITVDTETALLALQKLKKFYRDDDFHHAQFSFAITKDEHAPHKAALTITITENKKTRLQKIRFQGNHALSGRVLRRSILSGENWLFAPLSQAGKYNPQACEADKYLIGKTYREHGYFAARVTDTQVIYSDDKQQITLIYTIDEGPIFTVKTTDISEDKNFDHTLLKRLILHDTEVPYCESDLHKTLENIKNFYGESGYIDVDVNPSIVPNENNNTLDITFLVEKGHKWKLNTLSITGNHKTRDHVIRRQIFLEEGKVISSKMLDMSKRNVEALGYFDRESVTWKKHRIENGLLDLELNVKEVPSRKISGGINFGGNSSDPDSGAKLAFDWGVNNIDGRGWNLSGGLEAQLKSLFGSTNLTKSTTDPSDKIHRTDLKKSRLKKIQVSFSNPYLFDKNISFNLNLGINNSVYDRWKTVSETPMERTYTINGQIGFLLPTADHATHMLLDLGFEKIDNNNHIDPRTGKHNIQPGIRVQNRALMEKIINNTFEPGSMTWFGAFLVKNTLNHPVYPCDGYKVSLKTKFVPPYLSNRFSFAKVEFNSSWYTPLIGRDRLVLGLHAFGGAIDSLGRGHRQNDMIIPYKELFHLGGSNTIRGFEWGEAGPTWLNNPLGGKKAIQFNTELVFPVLDNYNMRAHIFYDAGCSWDTPQDDTLATYISELNNNNFNMRHTIGIGLNIVQPQPIKLSFGYKLDWDKRSGEVPSKFHIGMNAAF